MVVAAAGRGVDERIVDRQAMAVGQSLQQARRQTGENGVEEMGGARIAGAVESLEEAKEHKKFFDVVRESAGR